MHQGCLSLTARPWYTMQLCISDMSGSPLSSLMSTMSRPCECFVVYARSAMQLEPKHESLKAMPVICDAAVMPHIGSIRVQVGDSQLSRMNSFEGLLSTALRPCSC